MIKEYRDKIAEGTCSTAEVTLIGIVLILVGVIIGMILAPVRLGIYGSFNSNQGCLAPQDKDSIGSKDKSAEDD